MKTIFFITSLQKLNKVFLYQVLPQPVSIQENYRPRLLIVYVEAALLGVGRVVRASKPVMAVTLSCTDDTSASVARLDAEL